VRWDDVFAELAADAEELDRRERDAEIADRTRAELATITLADRFRAAQGRQVSVRVQGLGVLVGQVQRVTPHWLLLSSSGATEWLVAWSGVAGASGLPRQAVARTAGRVESALGWPATWRVLARDRATVHVVRHDGSSITGVAQRVGADFVEIQPGGSDDVELVPYASVTAVRCPRDLAG